MYESHDTRYTGFPELTGLSTGPPGNGALKYHVPIYRKSPKDFNEEKNLEYFSFYNIFDAYETKVKMREWFISYFLY